MSRSIHTNLCTMRRLGYSEKELDDMAEVLWQVDTELTQLAKKAEYKRLEREQRQRIKADRRAQKSETERHN